MNPGSTGCVLACVSAGRAGVWASASSVWLTPRIMLYGAALLSMREFVTLVALVRGAVEAPGSGPRRADRARSCGVPVGVY